MCSVARICCLLVSRSFAVIDNLSGKLYLVVYADPDQAARLARRSGASARTAGALRLPLSPPSETRDAETEVASNFDADRFRAAVDRAIRYVHDGDIMQVVLSQRCRVRLPDPRCPCIGLCARSTRRRTCSISIFGDFQVVSASPEILVRLERGTVTVRPIAGTRRRGTTQDEDVALERELLADPKERAEHVMLADLGRKRRRARGRDGDRPAHRNDGSRTLLARDAHRVECGRTAAGRAGLPRRIPRGIPAGTVSGAPKVRAMEIIDELEPDKRGVYAGAAGYLGFTAIWTSPLRSARPS